LIDLQNLAYAIDQIVHNFGAVAVTGGALAGTLLDQAEVRRRLAWVVLAGWGSQIASGVLFGLISYSFYHHFPDISGIAQGALMVKVSCAAAGFLLAAAYLRRLIAWSEQWTWRLLLLLAITALSGAAFLRWFS
jgi:hypothetical protein